MPKRRFRSRHPDHASEGKSHSKHSRNPRRKPPDQEPADFWSRLLGTPNPAGTQDGEADGNEFLEKTGCPACEENSARVLWRLGPTFLRQCRACSLVFITPRLAETVRREMLRREPAPLSSERNIQLRNQMAQRLEDMHREMLPLEGIAKGAASLLEIGCRWGHFLQLCRPHYRSVAGLEWSRERAAFASERFDLDVSATDLLRDPWPRTYHIITAWDQLEKETHPQAFLQWAFDHLLPGGQLVLSTPNYNALCRPLLAGHWRYFLPTRHLTYFTPATLSALLKTVGFQEISIRTRGLSSWREFFNGHNQIDRSQDTRSQWLQSLRAREDLNPDQNAHASSQDSLFKKLRRTLSAPVGRLLTAPGWGDTLRVYARKP